MSSLRDGEAFAVGYAIRAPRIGSAPKVEGVVVRQPGPDAEGGGVHGQHVAGAGHQRQPGFDLGGLGRVFLACQLNLGLDFAQRDGRHEQLRIGQRLQPGQHSAVRPGAA